MSLPRSCYVCGGVHRAGERCRTAERNRDQQRGSAARRGYGTAHTRLRRRWRINVERGEVSCARCGQPIEPGTPWDLDHTDDRTDYLGPSHASCNRSAASTTGARAA